MPNNVTPDGTFTVTVQSPADGEFVTGASVLTPVQALTNRTSFLKTDLDAMASGSAGVYRYIKTTEYTAVATGSHTYDARTNMVRVEIVGGGGGGGGVGSGIAGGAGGKGGGGGGANYHIIQFLKGSQTGSSYILGYGGTGGVNSATAAKDGGHTSFWSPTGQRIAQPGAAGTGGAAAAVNHLVGGFGSQLEPQEVIFSSFGNAGETGLFILLTGLSGSARIGGKGGSNILGGSASDRQTEGNGAAGEDNTGAGGCGAFVNTSTGRNGGAGGSGLVRVHEWQ